MTVIEEIRSHFATLADGLLELKSISAAQPTYCLRYNGEYGVGVVYDNDKDICEESTNAMISTRKVRLVNGDQIKLLLLTCYDEEYRNEFALLCETFVCPGENDELRKRLLDDPLAWWDKWIGLLGDRKSNKKCYDIIAEMIILQKLFEKDKTTFWAAQEKGSHDIECNSASYEVKSTIKKSDLNVTISSQHQLFSEKPLFLAFVRMEKSTEGVSINDMEKMLINGGYDKDFITRYLNDSGFYKGSRIRDEKYKVLEIRKYTVDDEFPKITKESFVNGQFPESIIKLIYTINIANIKYEKFE
jgi:hypothetical protein